MRPRRRRGWRWQILAIVLAGALAATLFAAYRAARAAEGGTAGPVDLELILALDCSYSVDDPEYALQTGGLAAAFSSPEVVAEIAAQRHGRIAVTVMQWSGPDGQVVAIPRQVIGDALSAGALAASLAAMPRQTSGGPTAIGDAMRFALALLPAAVPPGTRKVIDISGDGPSNSGMLLAQARAMAKAAGVDVNGLAIQFELRDLAAYYDSQVVVGPAAFVEIANGYDDFAAAIRRKLMREIRPRTLSGAPLAPILAPILAMADPPF